MIAVGTWRGWKTSFEDKNKKKVDLSINDCERCVQTNLQVSQHGGSVRQLE